MRLVLTAVLVLAVATGCSGGTQSGSSAPSSEPGPFTASSTYVDVSDEQKGPVDVPGLRPLPASAVLGGGGWQTRLGSVAVARKLPTAVASQLRLFRRSREGASGVPLVAPAGHEFLVAWIAASTGTSPASFRLIVAGGARSIDLRPGISNVFFAVVAPTGEDAFLQHTDAGNTHRISLRTGAVDSPMGCRKAGRRLTATGGVRFSFKTGNTTVVSDGSVHASVDWYVDGGGWAKAGRCWLLPSVQPYYLDSADSKEVQTQAPPGFSGLAPKVVAVSSGGTTYSGGNGYFDVPESAQVFKVTLEPGDPRKNGAPLPWSNADTGRPSSPVVVMLRLG